MNPPADISTDNQKNSFAIIALLISATFVVILNETLMNVALPNLMQSLRIAEVSTVQWVATAFLLTMSVVIPTTGFLLSRLSTRQAFILAMGLFTLGTAVCAAAPAFPVLIAGRVIQAMGTAVMMPLLMTTILQLVPHERRGAVMGNVSIAISVAPAIGPALSGLILQHFEWRFLFIFMLPIALAMFAAGLLRLKNIGEAEDAHKPALDLVSVLLTIPGFGGFVYGVNEIAVAPTPLTVGVLVVGLVCLALFVRRQISLQQGGEPLLDLRVFALRPFATGLALMVVSMLTMFGTIILFPLFLQQMLHTDTLTTGLMMLPGGLIMGLAAPPVGRLFDRIGARPLVPPRGHRPGDVPVHRGHSPVGCSRDAHGVLCGAGPHLHAGLHVFPQPPSAAPVLPRLGHPLDAAAARGRRRRRPSHRGDAGGEARLGRPDRLHGRVPRDCGLRVRRGLPRLADDDAGARLLTRPRTEQRRPSLKPGRGGAVFAERCSAVRRRCRSSRGGGDQPTGTLTLTSE